MVVDRSGSLGGVRRHDFLPFGEELVAGVGIRSAALGYGVDSTRQKFTGKERDNETSLDYFLARYYSSTQGRFTSPDVPFADQSEEDPQSWNLYVYVGNNPLTYIDPFGMWKRVSCGDGDCWESDREDDTLETLSEQSGVRRDALSWAFGSFEIKSGETVINVTGVEADHRAYLIDGFNQMPLFEPAIGGGIIKRYGRAAAGSIISRAWSGLKNYFGRRSAGAAKNIGGITAAQAAKLRELLESIPGVQKVGAFGSRTKGTYTAISDLDIALFGEINRYNPNTLRIIREVQKYAESIGIGTGKGHTPLDINVWKSIKEMKQAFRNSPNFDPSKGVPTVMRIE
jgi:RHS repeat-associated protein